MNSTRKSLSARFSERGGVKVTAARGQQDERGGAPSVRIRASRCRRTSAAGCRGGVARRCDPSSSLRSGTGAARAAPARQAYVSPAGVANKEVERAEHGRDSVRRLAEDGVITPKRVQIILERQPRQRSVPLLPAQKMSRVYRHPSFRRGLFSETDSFCPNSPSLTHMVACRSAGTAPFIVVRIDDDRASCAMAHYPAPQGGVQLPHDLQRRAVRAEPSNSLPRAPSISSVQRRADTGEWAPTAA